MNENHDMESVSATSAEGRMAGGLLGGVKVLELGHYVAAPYCTKLMAAHGAEVVKIERPLSGDGARAVGPFPEDQPHPERSALFLYLNTGKQSLTVNLKTEAGRAIVQRLAAEADVLVENFAPRVLASLGLDYPALAQANPRLVMVSISNFGQTGPYCDYKANSLVGFALGGYMYLNGHPEREPLGGSGYQPAYQGALHAFSGAMAALLAREHTGRGQHVDISIMECMASIHQFTLNRYHYVGRVQKRIGNRYQRAHPITIYPCQDGLVSLAVSTDEQYGRLLAALEMSELLDDPRFQSSAHCSENDRAFDKIAAPWFLSRKRQEIVTLLQSARVPAALVNDVQQVLADEQYQARGYWHQVEHPVAGSLAYPGLPYPRLGVETERACLLGEHTESILCGRLGYTRLDLAQLRRQGVV